jgi:hypothetical protein
VIILDKLNLKSDGKLIALFRNHLTSIIKIMDIAQDVVAVIYFTNMNPLKPAKSICSYPDAIAVSGIFSDARKLNACLRCDQ